MSIEITESIPEIKKTEYAGSLWKYQSNQIWLESLGLTKRYAYLTRYIVELDTRRNKEKPSYFERDYYDDDWTLRFFVSDNLLEIILADLNKNKDTPNAEDLVNNR